MTVRKARGTCILHVYYVNREFWAQWFKGNSYDNETAAWPFRICLRILYPLTRTASHFRWCSLCFLWHRIRLKFVFVWNPYNIYGFWKWWPHYKVAFSNIRNHWSRLQQFWYHLKQNCCKRVFTAPVKRVYTEPHMLQVRFWVCYFDQNT